MKNENINIPVKVGDTILTGRFKNKKIVVKSIGKDEHGMPTINGKKVVTFRMINEESGNPKWWAAMSPKQQTSYIRKHPGSKMAQQADKKDRDSGSGPAKSATDARQAFGKSVGMAGKLDARQQAQKGDKDPGRKDDNVAKKVAKKVGKKIENWSKKEKEFFNRMTEDGGKAVKRGIVKTLKDKIKGAGKAIAKGLKHEAELFKGAGKTLMKLAGKTKYQDLSKEEKDELKGVAKKVVTTALFAGATGGAAHGVAALAKHVAVDLIPHVVGETLIAGVGRAAMFADDESDTEANLNKFIEVIIDNIENVDIPEDVYVSAVDKYNKDKEAKETNDMMNESKTILKELLKEQRLK